MLVRGEYYAIVWLTIDDARAQHAHERDKKARGDQGSPSLAQTNKHKHTLPTQLHRYRHVHNTHAR
jgi:hypothetical protein